MLRCDWHQPESNYGQLSEPNARFFQQSHLHDGAAQRQSEKGLPPCNILR